MGTGHRRGVVPGRCSEGTHPGKDPASPVLRRSAEEHRQRAAARSERSLRAVRGGQEVRQETRGREVELQAVMLFHIQGILIIFKLRALNFFLRISGKFQNKIKISGKF